MAIASPRRLAAGAEADVQASARPIPTIPRGWHRVEGVRSLVFSSLSTDQATTLSVSAQSEIGNSYLTISSPRRPWSRRLRQRCSRSFSSAQQSYKFSEISACSGGQSGQREENICRLTSGLSTVLFKS